MARATVQKLYQSVIEDVITNVQEIFIDEGVDEQTLMELKQMWEKKVAETKAVESDPEPVRTRAPIPQLGGHRMQIQQPVRVTPVRNSMAVGAGDARRSDVLRMLLPPKYTITLPARMAQEGLQSLVTTSRGQLTQLLQTPQSNPGQQIPGVQYQLLTAQQLQNSPQFAVNSPVTSAQQKQTSNIVQLDGADDGTSDEDSLSYSDDDEERFEDDGIEEEPLNSDDDESDDDLGEFDAENVVVCQYEKIQRSKNRWKFHLKDGIMTVRGKDFVFQRALGDSEW